MNRSYVDFLGSTLASDWLCYFFFDIGHGVFSFSWEIDKNEMSLL